MIYRKIIIVVLALLALHSCTEPGDKNIEINETLAEKEEVINLPDSVFFWSDIVPVVYKNCTPCHHENGAGPFPLTAYEDLKKRTKTIRLAVADGFMPPWPADPEYRHFKGEKTLTSYERAVILEWISQGAQEGDKPEIVPQPTLLAEQNPGPPDLIIPFPDTIRIEGNNRDKFIVAKMSFELPVDTFLRAIYFAPGNKELLHHVNGHLLNYQYDNKSDLFEGTWIHDAEKSTTAQAYKSMQITHDDGTYPPLLASAFNYLPGVEALDYPEGIGGVFVNRKATFLLNTLHYGPSPADTFDFSEVHIYFAEKRPERPLREIHLGTLGITPVVPKFIIPADTISNFSTRYVVPEDISLLTINPHMHLLGTIFKAYAVSVTKQDTIPLIHIPKWDFRWQYFYTFEKMLKIPKGYEIVAEATFDNTMNNPLNPNNPPKSMTAAGAHMKTTDEMFQFFISYVPFRAGDENIKL